MMSQVPSRTKSAMVRIAPCTSFSVECASAFIRLFASLGRLSSTRASLTSRETSTKMSFAAIGATMSAIVCCAGTCRTPSTTIDTPGLQPPCSRTARQKPSQPISSISAAPRAWSSSRSRGTARISAIARTKPPKEASGMPKRSATALASVVLPLAMPPLMLITMLMEYTAIQAVHICLATPPSHACHA
jgi:hypothetical protein